MTVLGQAALSLAVGAGVAAVAVLVARLGVLRAAMVCVVAGWLVDVSTGWFGAYSSVFWFMAVGAGVAAVATLEMSGIRVGRDMSDRPVLPNERCECGAEPAVRYLTPDDRADPWPIGAECLVRLERRLSASAADVEAWRLTALSEILEEQERRDGV